MKTKSVLITGTTSGVGRALLKHYAKSGVKVIAVNRRRAAELESAYPAVRFECLDVRAAGAIAELFRALSAAGELPEVFVLNAGINRLDNDRTFQLDPFREVFDTNLFGALNFVQPLSELAPGEVPRHVVAVSSLAQYVGNPYGLGYHASKRALTACFDVLSRMYAGTDLVFQQVMLGPVPTAIFTMAEQFPPRFARLKDVFSVPAERAAHAIARFATTRKQRLFYPWRAVALYLALWLARSLVPGFFRGRRTLAGTTRRTGATPEAGAEQLDEVSR